ncbi:MAG: hypothetical protein AUG49_08825 [Catenulispora sp. 13_1_20CM_3_70_7]|nr:MAG: hypothetical protein AUG49_08825 [Catenulispora sp. 13_1_20CM_3_70_7]
MTAMIAPAVCRMIAPTARANSPSIIRYKPTPIRARRTPWSPRLTRTLLRRIGAPIAKAPKETISPMTNVTAAKTSPLAASIGVRFGTASNDARIMPVEYSEAITMMPRTQMAT